MSISSHPSINCWRLILGGKIMKTPWLLIALLVATSLWAADENSPLNIEQILQQRKKTIDGLQAAFADTGDITIKVKIMFALGELRATPAVKLLIDNIKMGQAGAETRLSAYGSEPAATALAKIGVPSVRPVLAKLKENIDELSRAIFANVLMDIYGVPVAQFVLEQEIRSTKDTVEKCSGKGSTLHS